MNPISELGNIWNPQKLYTHACSVYKFTTTKLSKCCLLKQNEENRRGAQMSLKAFKLREPFQMSLLFECLVGGKHIGKWRLP